MNPSICLRIVLVTSLCGSIEMRANADLAVERPRAASDPWCEGTVAPDLDMPREMILDDSRSMRGFMADERSRIAYWSIVGGLIGDLAPTTRNFFLYRLSRLSEPMKEYQPASGAGFYGDSHTPLSAMFDHIGAVRTPLVVVVSDLEQQENGRDVNALTKALRGALGWYKCVLLIGYKMHYYSGSGRACERLLYAMVMARNAAILDSFESETHALRRSYSGTGVIDVSNADEEKPLTFRSCGVVRVDLFADDYGGSGKWQQRSEPSFIACESGGYVVRTFLSYVGEGPIPAIRFAVAASTTLRVHDPARMTITLCDEVPSKAHPKKHPPPCRTGRVSAYGPHDDTGMTDENPLSFTIAYDLGQFRGAARYRGYLFLGDGNVEPPRWVDEWSTVDPREPGCSGSPPHARTLYLRSIVDAIIRSNVEGLPFLSQSIDVKSEKP